MSASQPVRSQVVRPIDPAADSPIVPIPAPDMVKLADPVLAAFAFAETLIGAAPTADRSPVALPPRTPADTDTSRLPAELWPAKLRTELSDSHDVRSP